MNTDKTYAEQLASEYAPKDTSKVVALRKLDQRAKLPATIAAYSIGVAAALVLGVGMCLSMSVVGDGSQVCFIGGIALGVAGIAGICADYPLYQHLLAQGKQKYAADIIWLAAEISK